MATLAPPITRTELREEMQVLRAELRDEMQLLRDEFREHYTKADLAEVKSELIKWIVGVGLAGVAAAATLTAAVTTAVVSILGS